MAGPSFHLGKDRLFGLDDLLAQLLIRSSLLDIFVSHEWRWYTRQMVSVIHERPPMKLKYARTPPWDEGSLDEHGVGLPDQDLLHAEPEWFHVTGRPADGLIPGLIPNTLHGGQDLIHALQTLFLAARARRDVSNRLMGLRGGVGAGAPITMVSMASHWATG